MSSHCSNINIWNFAPVQIVTNMQTQKHMNERERPQLSPSIQPPLKKRKISDSISHLCEKNRNLLRENQQLMIQNQQLLIQSKWYKNKLLQLNSIINECFPNGPSINIRVPFTEITELNKALRVQKPAKNERSNHNNKNQTHFKLHPIAMKDIQMDVDNSDDLFNNLNTISDDSNQQHLQRKLLPQRVLSFEFDINAKQKKHHNKSRINQALDIDNLAEQRKCLRKLLKEIPECTDTIQFSIGNAYEREHNTQKAIDWYNKSLITNMRNRKYFESLAVYHKSACILNTEGMNGIRENTLNALIDAWKNTELKEDKYQRIRKEWMLRGEIKCELIGSVECCLLLARYFEEKSEKNDNQQWNDTSLIWYKRAMNILEKLEIIIIKHTSVYDEIRMLFILNSEAKDAEIIPRKMVNEKYQNVDFLRTAACVMRNYMQCIIERFRKDEYGKIEEDVSSNACFGGYHRSKEEYLGDFELYLQHELNSVFEMNHEYFKHKISRTHNTDGNIADIYINYASYITDVCGEHETALLLYEHALKWNKDAIAFWNMAEIYEKLKKYEECITYLDLVKQYAGFSETIIQEADEFKKRVGNKC